MGRGSLDFDNVPPHEVHAVRTLSDPTYGMLVTIPYREPEGDGTYPIPVLAIPSTPRRKRVLGGYRGKSPGFRTKAFAGTPVTSKYPRFLVGLFLNRLVFQGKYRSPF